MGIPIQEFIDRCQKNFDAAKEEREKFPHRRHRIYRSPDNPWWSAYHYHKNSWNECMRHLSLTLDENDIATGYLRILGVMDTDTNVPVQNVAALVNFLGILKPDEVSYESDGRIRVWFD